MLNLLKKIYESIPSSKLVFLKYIPGSLLFGKNYYSEKTKINFDRKVLESNLFKTLKYVYDNTQYGKDTIPKIFYPDEVFSVYSELPLISSDDISLNIDYYKSKKFNKTNSYFATTGGTGRNPTPIILSNASFGAEWAYMHSIWSMIGYKRENNIKLTFRGKQISGNKLYNYSPLYNEVIVDSFRLNKDNFIELFNDLKNFKIDFIHGYPSLVKEFKQYLEMYGLIFNVNGIFLGSEGISVNDKKELSEFFSCKVISWYGQSEKIILAYNIDFNDKFQVFTSYGYPQICNPDDSGLGEIIGTSFINRALPLVKYRTGDYGRIIESDNGLIIKDIAGRWGKDFVYLNQYKRIPCTSVNIHSDIQKEILFYQIYQNEYGKLMIKILPKKTTKLSEEQIIHQFEFDISSKLSEFQTSYQVISDENEIVRSKRGKMILLVQDLK